MAVMHDSFTKSIVKGYVWKCYMSNGAVFKWWTPCEVSRKTARIKLYAIANAMCAVDNPAYVKGDIERMWSSK